MKSIIKGAVSVVAGKKQYQRLFEGLYQLSLSGMNIGGGARTDSSGEEVAIQYVHSKLKDTKEVVIFDVGANIGDYTILLNTMFGGKAKLFAFEPSQKTYQKFISNTKDLKGLQHYNFGFGNEDTKITLYSNADESGLASVYNRRLEHIDIHMNKTEEIEIRTVDGFCEQNGIERINFLKIDVEGHELKVLEGARHMLGKKAVDFIQFEFGGCNIDSRTYFQDFYYLLKDNFIIYRIVKDGLYRIEEYKEMYEVFMTTNFIAERKPN